MIVSVTILVPNMDHITPWYNLFDVFYENQNCNQHPEIFLHSIAPCHSNRFSIFDLKPNFQFFPFMFSSWKKSTRRLILQSAPIQHTKRPNTPNLPPRNAGTTPNSPLNNARPRLPPAKQHSLPSSRPKLTHKDHSAAILLLFKKKQQFIYNII